jgi:hypothetical protein
MQVFLPYQDFKLSLRCLDYKRLGKQRVECKQIIQVLDGTSVAWRNHPAVKMWMGYRNALVEYHNYCIDEWINRGYYNSMLHIKLNSATIDYPWWLGNDDFHRAMRARLIEKNRDHYLPLFPHDENFNGGKYFWPDNETKSFKVI